MNPTKPLYIWNNEQGAGLILAIFVIVILGLFGTLIARYTVISATESAEQYLWAQSAYAAEAAAQLRILTHDGGGGGGPSFPLIIQQFTIPAPAPDTFTAVGGRGNAAEIGIRASRANVVRRIEQKFLL